MGIKINKCQKLQFKQIDSGDTDPTHTSVITVLEVAVIKVFGRHHVRRDQQSMQVAAVHSEVHLVLLRPIDQDQRVDEHAQGAVHVREQP